MNIKYLENGGIVISNGNGTVTLNANDAWCLYRDLRRNQEMDALKGAIKGLNDWDFEKSPEEVTLDDELMSDLWETMDYENTDIGDEQELYWLLEKYLDLKEENNE